MALIIDSHVHVLPDPKGYAELTKNLRRAVGNLTSPGAKGFHRAQPWLRWLPEKVRAPVEWLGSAYAGATMLARGYASDLKEQLDSGKIDRACVIAHPSAIPNEFVVSLAEEDPRIIAVVSAHGEENPAQSFPEFARRGARGLKIHAAADGFGVDHIPYRVAIETASGLDWPVILHTGCMHGPMYKNLEFGNPDLFEPWFTEFPNTKFILAHMNLHEPRRAMDLAEHHSNLYLETSWQPMEVISEAVRRIGSHRVLFGSDWPIGGQNIEVGLNRIEDCLETGTLRIEDVQLILGKNAIELFKIQEHLPAREDMSQ